MQGDSSAAAERSFLTVGRPGLASRQLRGEAAHSGGTRSRAAQMWAEAPASVGWQAKSRGSGRWDPHQWLSTRPWAAGFSSLMFSSSY